MKDDSNSKNLTINRRMIFLVNIQKVLDSYTCILKKYLSLSDNKTNKRFLNNRNWLENNYDLKENILSFVKMPYEVFDDELVDYCSSLTTDIDNITKSVALKRIATLESKIIAESHLTKKEKKSTVANVSIISAAEMFKVRDTMQSFKNSNVGLVVEQNLLDGDKYYIASESELNENVISKNYDSEVKVSIKRQLEAIEIVNEDSRERAVKELQDSLLNLNANVDMMWVILCDNFIKQLTDGSLTELGEATLNFEDIHFKFRGRDGKKDGSGIPIVTINSYVQLIKTLSSFKANIKLNTKSMKRYYNFSGNSKFKNNESYSLDSNIINSNFIYKESILSSGVLEKIPVGVRYNLDLLGKLYLTETKMINNKVPSTMLQYDINKHSPAYNIYMRLVYLSNSNKKKYESVKINLDDMIRIAHFNYDTKRKSLYIKRFLNTQVKKALDDAVNDNLITSYKIPNEKDLNMKYLDLNLIEIFF
ncbi:hypothetical protein P5E71_14990 [Clostridium perfringens]|uniref:hypothetical protein n=1 Tax=Clostridium perfringens TaxID=1502 RepID=UPI00285CA866|nr:hypothetical protein [Clostridium perfringens]MDK0672290.1 hypothetical protein [Clostridium perfringens]MDM0455995.1 hypothetical protein [Clostridium perfringens]